MSELSTVDLLNRPHRWAMMVAYPLTDAEALERSTGGDWNPTMGAPDLTVPYAGPVCVYCWVNRGTALVAAPCQGVPPPKYVTAQELPPAKLYNRAERRRRARSIVKGR